MEQNEETLHHRFAEATLERAQALWELGSREQALIDFQEAYASTPDLASHLYSKAVYQMGIEKQDEGDLEGAMEDFQFAAEIAAEGDWQNEIQNEIKALEYKIHPPVPETTFITECPNCVEKIEPDWEFCPYCSTNLKPPSQPNIPNLETATQTPQIAHGDSSSSPDNEIELISKHDIEQHDDQKEINKDNIVTRGMFVKEYSIPSLPSSKLELYHDPGWRKLILKLNGKTIGIISGKNNMHSGKTFKLSAGNSLSVRLLISRLDYSKKIYLSYNDTTLPGSTSPEELAFSNAKGCSFIVVALNVIVNIAFFGITISGSDSLFGLLLSILEPIVLLILAFWISRKSEIALLIFIVLYGLGGLIFALLAFQAGDTINSIAAIAWRTAALAILIPGWEALKKINLRIKE